MQSVLFTKLFHNHSISEVAEVAKELGFDGIDLLIRPGFQVEPARPEAIPAAIRTLKNAGLAVPMATTDITDPAQDTTVERLLQTCAEEDVRLIRLGYW